MCFKTHADAADARKQIDKFKPVWFIAVLRLAEQITQSSFQHRGQGVSPFSHRWMVLAVLPIFCANSRCV
ncbi:hypothetical protein [Neisseria subflava]|uniref:hypothetical protein n=1 Tax=Neisseria subflava TaxID=28449 RepID=UPI00202AC086|nr:hypothetical protein [Neisseria subflava]